jgi:hypothetical protein
MKQNKVIVLIVIVVAIYYIHCSDKKQSSFGAGLDSVNVELINKTGATVGVVFNTYNPLTNKTTSKTTIINNGSSYKFTFTKDVNSIKLIPIGTTVTASNTINYVTNWVAGSTLKYDILIKSSSTSVLTIENSTDNIPVPATTGPECAPNECPPPPECPKSGGFCSIM